jgi:hypothetical protein
VAVDRQRREGRVAVENVLHRRARRRELGIVEAALAKGRGEAGGEQHRVAASQRQRQAFGKPHHHIARRPRSAGLDEAEVARRDLRLEREIELAHVALAAPEPQLIAELLLIDCNGHGPFLPMKG